MKIIIYKIILGKYELTDLRDDGGEELQILLEEPVSGRLMLGSRVFNVTRGMCKLKTHELPDGEISPKLITAGAIRNLESFISHGGHVSRKAPDAEYIRSLGAAADTLFKRVSAIEKTLTSIEKKLNQKIEF